MKAKRFYISRAWSIARKEIRHILRDPFTMAVVFGLPMLLLVFFGYAIDFNVKDVHIAVNDQDHSRASRQLLAIVNSSRYLVTDRLAPGDLVMEKMDSEQAKGTMMIAPGFGRQLGAGQSAQVEILLDGADNSTTGMIMGYLSGIERSAQAQLATWRQRVGLQIKTRFLYNPELNSRWFIVPGLIVVIIGFLSILLTALTIAREWETGSMELLLSTPVRPLEIILGKIMPYFFMTLVSVTIVYLIARLQFGLPFRGSHVLLVVGAGLFLTLCLAQGLLISVITRQQQLAMQLSFISGLLPTFLLSGFIFPIESMPAFFQYLTTIIAPRWFMVISRNLFLKGAGWLELAEPLIMLLLLNLTLVTIALKRFKKDLEP